MDSETAGQDLIVRKRVVESDIIILTYVAFLHKWDSNRRLQKVHVNTATREEKERFKKEQKDTGQSPRRIHISIY